MSRRALKWLWRSVAPRRYWAARLAALQGRMHEPELALCGALGRRGAIAVDVGAAGGIFAAHLLPHVESVLAFEPRPGPAGELAKMARVLGLPIRVEAVALSDGAGTATLRMLAEDLGRSTIDAGNALADPDGSPRVSIEVPLRRLDDYSLERVGFVKIDVEGHELAVLRGAQATLDRCRPRLLVEVEDRHHAGATAGVFEAMTNSGYAGWFLLDTRLQPIDRFHGAVHQNEANIGGWRSGWQRRGVYINNFIFAPGDEAAPFLAACAALGFTLG